MVPASTTIFQVHRAYTNSTPNFECLLSRGFRFFGDSASRPHGFTDAAAIAQHRVNDWLTVRAVGEKYLEVVPDIVLRIARRTQRVYRRSCCLGFICIIGHPFCGFGRVR